MKKSIIWLSLVAASLALSGCGGGEPAKDEKPAAAPKKKKGAKEEPNPWAKEPPQGSQPTEPVKKAAAKKKGKGGEEANPWAKETPKPAET